MVRVLRREADVPLAELRDPDARVVARLLRGGEDARAQELEPLGGEGIEEGVAVGEMPVGGVVRDAGGARELAHREVEAPPLGEERQRGVEQGAAEVPVVVVGARAHDLHDSVAGRCGQSPHCRLRGEDGRANVDTSHMGGPMSAGATSSLTASAEKAERAAKAEKRRAHLATPESVDVAIVGAGLGALVAGAHLARQGFRVACFEQHYVAGGCATQFSRGPKRARYHFDVGLHYIGDCGREGAIPRLLREVGVELGYERLDPDGFDTLVFPGLEFRVPADLDRYRDRLRALFPRETGAIDRYVRIQRATMKVVRVLDARGGRTSFRTLFAMGLAGLRVAGIQARTIGEVLDGCGVRDPALRAIMLGQSGDYGLPPSAASAVLHFGLAGHYFHGAYYPRGGGQTIADRLAEVIERAGGTVHLRRGVERILVGPSGAVEGVRLEARGGEPARDVRERVVLSNADLKMTLERLVGVEHLPASWVQRAKGFEMAAALFLTFLGVKADLRAMGMRNANYWQFDDFDTEKVYRAAAGGDLRARGAYITSSSLKDPTNATHHAPAGVTNVEVMTIVPGSAAPWGVAPDEAEAWRYRETAVYRERKAALEEQLIGRLDALFPGAARAVVFRESSTPVTHVRFTRATGGTGARSGRDARAVPQRAAGVSRADRGAVLVWRVDARRPRDRRGDVERAASGGADRCRPREARDGRRVAFAGTSSSARCRSRGG